MVCRKLISSAAHCSRVRVPKASDAERLVSQDQGKSDESLQPHLPKKLSLRIRHLCQERRRHRLPAKRRRATESLTLFQCRRRCLLCTCKPGAGFEVEALGLRIQPVMQVRIDAELRGELIEEVFDKGVGVARQQEMGQRIREKFVPLVLVPELAVLPFPLRHVFHDGNRAANPALEDQRSHPGALLHMRKPRLRLRWRKRAAGRSAAPRTALSLLPAARLENIDRDAARTGSG